MSTNSNNNNIKNHHTEDSSSNSEHWTFGCIYNNPEDKRVLVSKRPLRLGTDSINLGWTFNWAHNESYVLATGIAGVTVGALVVSRNRIKVQRRNK